MLSQGGAYHHISSIDIFIIVFIHLLFFFSPILSGELRYYRKKVFLKKEFSVLLKPFVLTKCPVKPKVFYRER